MDLGEAMAMNVMLANKMLAAPSSMALASALISKSGTHVVGFLQGHNQLLGIAKDE